MKIIQTTTFIILVLAANSGPIGPIRLASCQVDRNVQRKLPLIRQFGWLCIKVQFKLPFRLDYPWDLMFGRSNKYETVMKMNNLGAFLCHEEIIAKSWFVLYYHLLFCKSSKYVIKKYNKKTSAKVRMIMIRRNFRVDMIYILYEYQIITNRMRRARAQNYSKDVFWILAIFLGLYWNK